MKNLRKLLISSAIVGLAVGHATGDFTYFLQQRCDDLSQMRGCGQYQTMMPDLEDRATQLVMEHDQMFLQQFVTYSQMRFAATSDSLEKFRIAYLGYTVDQAVNQSHNSETTEDDYFSNLFRSLGINLTTVPEASTLPTFEETSSYLQEEATDTSFVDRAPERRSTRSSSSTNTTTSERSVRRSSIVDSPLFDLNLSRTSYPDVSSRTDRIVPPSQLANGNQSVRLSRGGAIQYVRSPHHATHISRGGEIRMDTDLLELEIEAVLDNAQPARPEDGYVLVAVPDRAGQGGRPVTLSYNERTQRRYVSLSHGVNPFDRLTVYLLCETCDGSSFPYQGGFRRRSIIDRANFSVSKNRYRPHRETLYQPRDYLKSSSTSLSLTDATIYSSHKGSNLEATIYLTIKNNGLQDARMDIDDLVYRITTTEKRLDRSDYHIDDEDLDCEDGGGNRVRMSPLSSCEVEINIEFDDLAELRTAEIVITHTASSHRQKSAKLQLPYNPYHNN